MAAQLKNKIRIFEENTVGSDYVVGDIHGCFDLVYESLKKINFDTSNDRLFCVGDLIDRGMFSSHIVDFLQLPFVYAVRGNHEDMLLDFYEKNPDASDQDFFIAGYQNGMSWFLENSQEKREEILSILHDLPLIIEIKSPRGLVGLVHADVPSDMDWEMFKNEVLNGNEKMIETALWGRSRILGEVVKDVPGLGRLYVGHTVQSQIKKLGNVVDLDTGAVFDQHLSMVNINCLTQAILTPKNPNDKIFNIVVGEVLPFAKSKL